LKREDEWCGNGKISYFIYIRVLWSFHQISKYALI
jgi:hypothetical protein